MPIYDRRNRRDLDQLVEEYITTCNINRRQFLQRATAAGLSISGASALLAACGGSSSSTTGTPSTVTSIDVLTVWSGNELANFQMQNAAFKAKTGITVNVESTRDLPTVLNTRVTCTPCYRRPTARAPSGIIPSSFRPMAIPFPRTGMV